MKKGNTKHVAILATSGLDSTYLIQLAVEKKYKISLIYITIQNNGSKPRIEYDNLMKIKRHYEEKHSTYIDVIKHMCEIDSSLYSPIFKQFPTNFFSVLSAAGSVDEIWLGYVMNDDMTSYVDDFKKTYKSLAWLYGDKFGTINHMAKLKFPVLKMKKDTILELMDKEALKHVWWCENPREDDKACMHCDSCNRYKNMNHRMINNHYINGMPEGKMCDDDLMLKSKTFVEENPEQLKLNLEYAIPVEVSAGDSVSHSM